MKLSFKRDKMLCHQMNPSKTNSTYLDNELFKTRQNLVLFLKDRKGEGYWTVRRFS